jgi:transcriptional regulator with XRE-family HTH domain
MRKKNNTHSPVEMKEESVEAILKKFGENLKALREGKELSQEAIAFNAGLSRSYYAEVELGKRNISLINITKIAVALDTELDALLSLKEIKKKIK